MGKVASSADFYQPSPIISPHSTSTNLHEKHLAFADFIARHGRSYASKTELETRFEIFASNYDAMQAHNEQFMAGNTLYQRGINKFADLTKEEFDNRYHTALLGLDRHLKANRPKVSSGHRLKNRFWDWLNPWQNREETDADEEDTNPITSPDQQNEPQIIRHAAGDIVNWYTAGKVSESVDQGGCGGCWAFVTATTLESLNAIENELDAVPTYSVQYLMDCDSVNWGCDGGWMFDAYEQTA